jgi:hypothetical protein
MNVRNLFCFISPVIVFVAGVAHSYWSGFESKTVWAQLFLFLFTAHIARFVFRRARNLDARLFTGVVSSSDSEESRLMSDAVARIAAGLFVFASLFLPWFSNNWPRLYP